MYRAGRRVVSFFARGEPLVCQYVQVSRCVLAEVKYNNASSSLRAVVLRSHQKSHELLNLFYLYGVWTRVLSNY